MRARTLRWGALCLVASGLACEAKRVAFAPATSQELSGSQPRAAVSADFDGDGHLDIAVTSSAVPGELSVAFGDGDGGFADAEGIDLGLPVWGLEVGDFDEDGALDLAVTSGAHDDTQVQVLLGDGAGGFEPGDVARAGRFPVALVAGDFDEDGHLDLVVANNVLYGVSFLHGRGDGSFAAPAHLAGQAGLLATDVASGDLDGDGHLDVAVSHYGGVRAFLGDGRGGFDPSAEVATATNGAVAMGDLDRDGRDDVVSVELYAGRAVVSLGRGDRSFSPPKTYAIGDFAVDVILSDLTGDGLPEIVVASSGEGRVGVLQNQGFGQFMAEQAFGTLPQPMALAVGDWNEDGRADLAVACRNLGDTALLSVLLQSP